jgi:hypothetical protein
VRRVGVVDWLLATVGRDSVAVLRDAPGWETVASVIGAGSVDCLAARGLEV